MKKRIISLLLAVCMLLPLLPQGAEAAEYAGTCGADLTWVFNPYDNTLTISGTGKMQDYRPGFAEPWLPHRLNIQKVVVEEGVTHLGSYAFCAYTNLTEVSLPSTLASIGGYTFDLCTSLKEITLPAGLRSCSSSSFWRCEGLETVRCEEGLTYIGGFAACTALTTVELPDSLERIGAQAFQECAALEEIVIPNGVVAIESSAFRSCTSLKTIRIPASVTAIGAEHEYAGTNAFENCNSLDGIWVDEENPNYSSDSHGVLYNKEKTQLLSIPGGLVGEYSVADGVTEIESSLFLNCTGLTGIVIPESVTTLGGRAFQGCTALKKAELRAAVTELWTEMFMDCTALEEVILPEGLTVIGSRAFYNCGNLKKITLPDSLTTIKEDAFYHCAALPEIDLPEGLQTIDSTAFAGCKSLTSVCIPASVTSISGNPFAGCTALTGIYAAPENPVYADADGVLFNKKITKLLAVPGGITGSYSVPDTVTAIGGSAFHSCHGLTKVVLPSTVTSLGGNAFGNCSGLTEVTLPDSVTSIGWYAFVACTSLPSFVVPDSVTFMDQSVFYGCTALEEVTFSGGMKEIPWETFKNCTSLQTVHLGPNTTKIECYAFQGCTGMTSFTVPGTVKEVESSAFEDCTGLTEIVLEEGVELLGNYAFTGCTALTEVHLPASLSEWNTTNVYYGLNLFYQCDSLRDIWYGADEIQWNRVHRPELLEEHPLVTVHFAYGSVCGEGAHTLLTDPAREVTCTEDGLTEGSHCGLCGTVFTEQTVIPSTGHSWDGGEVTKAPTETETGVLTYTCHTCGGTKTEELPVHVHEYAKFHFLATCTEQGYVEYLCRCGDTYKGDYTDALGHDWDEGRVTKVPTEYREGEKTYTCTRENCWETYTEKLPMLDHTHSYENGVCTGCGGEDPNWAEPGEAITRLAGDNRFLTAFMAAEQMKQAMGVERFDNMIVASGTNFADALSGSYLAAVKNAPILLSCTSSFHAALAEKYNNMIVEYIRENLSEGGTVYILGGTAAVDASLDEALAGYTVKRLAGANRYATNIAILEEAGYEGKDVLVCNGDGFADSLSASAAKLPILLVNSTFGLFDVQRPFLQSCSGQLHIIGGESAVSNALENQLGYYGAVYRVGGKNRFETSVMIAEAFFDKPESAVLAYAWNFPDGLCGGALASVMDAPLILTMDNYEAAAAEYIQTQGIRKAVILGSEALISDEAVSAIFQTAQ